ARPQDARLRLVLEQKAGRAGQHQHPFGPRLVVPEAGRARLTGRNDALDAQVLVCYQRDYLLGVEATRKRSEQISTVARHGAASCWMILPWKLNQFCICRQAATGWSHIGRTPFGRASMRPVA